MNCLVELEKLTIGKTIELLEGEEDVEQFELFIDYLITNDLAGIVDDLSVFPPLNLEWSYPSPITNAIIDIGTDHMTLREYLKNWMT